MLQLEALNLNYPSYFKESLNIVNLSDSHTKEKGKLETGPNDDPPVGVSVDFAVSVISDFHIILLLFHFSQLVS